jgi:short subunit dehydrogenase-like uncharacterized protein
MSREFDIIVYGATGYTGKRVAKYLVDTHPEIKLAISGRNSTKLEAVAIEIGLPTTNALTASTSSDEESKAILQTTLAKAKIVIACAGPFRHFGEAIVEAAVAAGTDYLDLCGEPQFFDDMLAKYDGEAQKNSTLVLSACAFDCVPAELTAQLAKKECRKMYPSSPVSNIEIVHKFAGEAVGNATTYHAAVDGFHAGITGELKASREKVKEALRLPKSFPRCPKEWPKIVQSPGNTPIYHEESDSYLLKFMGADAACVLASDRYLRYRSRTENVDENENVIDPHPYMSICFGCPSKSDAYKVLAYGAAFSLLARFKAGCKLLHSNPELFTNGVFKEGGPTEEQLAKGSFKTYCTAYGKDKDEFVKVVCEGPEPGYVATPKIIVGLALTVLNNRDKLRYQGGVMLPGVAFGECDEALEYLTKEGVEIKALSTGTGSNSESKV